ncbi:MAG: flagellar motor stator protein MotA [Alphaproteobacteria bacterium]|nr:flagellar motor stator protein MotA [Alphaproteobacteria bacterium]MBU0858761.1 flagellar motor stator protein MotA [Alphaproteobacteria bacterium]
MKLLGLLLVIGCTIGGFLWAGGHLAPILKAAPYEITIILGCAIGAFLIANSMHTVKATIKGLNCYLKPEAHNKESYLELLSVMYMIFKLARTKGWLALESHIENPHDSEMFKQFPNFHHDHHATTFICDYLRIISLGSENPHELEALIDMEIETIQADKMHPAHAVQSMADGIPALGIVAAVLGIIKTMGSITEPPEILGKMIGGALVGTFLGVWLAYGFIGPTAGALATKGESQVMYYKVMKVCLLAFLNGAAPQVAVEFGRKFLPHDVQPDFLELEEKLNALPAPG